MTRHGHDPGDEHVDPPPAPAVHDPIAELLAEWGNEGEVTAETMHAIIVAEAHRHCCLACALEVNGEDGA